MGILKDLYKDSLGLLTDLYQLTMAYSYWKTGRGERESVFHLTFRSNPFKGGYVVSCGLDYVIDYLDNFRISEDDALYLSSLKTPKGTRLFEDDFIDYLVNLKFTCSVDAIPEGTLVFPHEPLVKVQGPIIQCQLLETPLLNIINFQSLIATKAARVSIAAKGDPVLEFGLRRAQGIDGALAASRASYIGGCSSTSNVLAGKLFNIPVSGTHAHSWVMSFNNELDSFKAYAEALPDNCILLVDTYNTLEGVKHAVTVGEILREKGKELIGIRIDSGDLAYLSIEARKTLDAAGFENAKIFASNDLDENLISSLKEQDSEINAWGIGTKLVTGFDQPALGGVYKLSAIKDENGNWENKVKLSEQAIKINNPGVQQVRRYFDNGYFITDMIYDVNHPPGKNPTVIDPLDSTRQNLIDASYQFSDLLVPVFQKGKLIYESPLLTDIKEKVVKELWSVSKGVKRFVNPHIYPVGLHSKLFQDKVNLILSLRKKNNVSDLPA